MLYGSLSCSHVAPGLRLLWAGAGRFTESMNLGMFSVGTRRSEGPCKHREDVCGAHLGTAATVCLSPHFSSPTDLRGSGTLELSVVSLRLHLWQRDDDNGPIYILDCQLQCSARCWGSQTAELQHPTGMWEVLGIEPEPSGPQGRISTTESPSTPACIDYSRPRKQAQRRHLGWPHFLPMLRGQRKARCPCQLVLPGALSAFPPRRTLGL